MLQVLLCIVRATGILHSVFAMSLSPSRSRSPHRTRSNAVVIWEQTCVPVPTVAPGQFRCPVLSAVGLHEADTHAAWVPFWPSVEDRTRRQKQLAHISRLQYDSLWQEICAQLASQLIGVWAFHPGAAWRLADVVARFFNMLAIMELEFRSPPNQITLTVGNPLEKAYISRLQYDNLRREICAQLTSQLIGVWAFHPDAACRLADVVARCFNRLAIMELEFRDPPNYKSH